MENPDGSFLSLRIGHDRPKQFLVAVRLTIRRPAQRRPLNLAPFAGSSCVDDQSMGLLPESDRPRSFRFRGGCEIRSIESQSSDPGAQPQCDLRTLSSKVVRTKLKCRFLSSYPLDDCGNPHP